MPQALAYEWDSLIETSTTALREIDPIFKLCVEAGTDYSKGSDKYDQSVEDPIFLTLNVMYNTAEIYERSIAI